MSYTVYYKNNKSFFWKKLNNIKGDGIVDNHPVRFFIADDETRYEIPMIDTQFKFSNGRFLLIKQDMEQQARQPLAVNSPVK